MHALAVTLVGQHAHGQKHYSGYRLCGSKLAGLRVFKSMIAYTLSIHTELLLQQVPQHDSTSDQHLLLLPQSMCFLSRDHGCCPKLYVPCKTFSGTEFLFVRCQHTCICWWEGSLARHERQAESTSNSPMVPLLCNSCRSFSEAAARLDVTPSRTLLFFRAWDLCAADSRLCKQTIA